jgi:hypothetical protein
VVKQLPYDRLLFIFPKNVTSIPYNICEANFLFFKLSCVSMRWEAIPPEGLTLKVATCHWLLDAPKVRTFGQWTLGKETPSKRWEKREGDEHAIRLHCYRGAK